MQGDLNHQARQRRYARRAAFYDWQHNRDREWMARGPHLLDDGHTLAIPANRYNEAASAFWRSKGCTFSREPSVRWIRDTRQPLYGKVYTPDAWLLSARQQFAVFYPAALSEDAPCL